MEWQPIETAPIDELVFLACEAGEIERWHDYKEGVVVTRKARDHAFVCWRKADGTFMDWTAEEYKPDGVVMDAEPGEYDPNTVLRLTHWMPLPKPPEGV